MYSVHVQLFFGNVEESRSEILIHLLCFQIEQENTFYCVYWYRTGKFFLIIFVRQS